MKKSILKFNSVSHKGVNIKIKAASAEIQTDLLPSTQADLQTLISVTLKRKILITLTVQLTVTQEFHVRMM